MMFSILSLSLCLPSTYSHPILFYIPSMNRMWFSGTLCPGSENDEESEEMKVMKERQWRSVWRRKKHERGRERRKDFTLCCVVVVITLLLLPLHILYMPVPACVPAACNPFFLFGIMLLGRNGLLPPPLTPWCLPSGVCDGLPPGITLIQCLWCRDHLFY